MSKLKSWADGGAEAAVRPQLAAIAALPFVHSHLAVLPNLRAESGIPAGIVVATTDAVVPAAIGSDIGCGTMALRIGLAAGDVPDDLSALRAAIAAAVPHGGRDDVPGSDAGTWAEPPDANLAVLAPLEERLAALISKHPGVAAAALDAASDLGTLGGGGFIALCRDDEERLWVVLRAGSRRIGHAIAATFADRAREHMARWHIALPDPVLAYLPEDIDDFRDYIEAAAWAREYAVANRQLLTAATLAALEETLGLSLPGDVAAVDCAGNTIARERHFGRDLWVARNGAVAAGNGEFAVVAGDAGAPSFIVRGTGNPDSFASCPADFGAAATAAPSELAATVRTLHPLLGVAARAASSLR